MLIFEVFEKFFFALTIALIKCMIGRKIIYAVNAMLIVVLLQFALGVSTLLHAVPVHLASIHQMVALLLISIAVFINYALFSRRIV